MLTFAVQDRFRQFVWMMITFSAHTIAWLVAQGELPKLAKVAFYGTIPVALMSIVQWYLLRRPSGSVRWIGSMSLSTSIFVFGTMFGFAGGPIVSILVCVVFLGVLWSGVRLAFGRWGIVARRMFLETSKGHVAAVVLSWVIFAGQNYLLKGVVPHVNGSWIHAALDGVLVGTLTTRALFGVSVHASGSGEFEQPQKA